VAWSSVVYLRPHIQAPIKAPECCNTIPAGARITGTWIQDAAGNHVHDAHLLDKAAIGGTDSGLGVEGWLKQHHYTNWVSYQPESRFWHFQIVEASAYVVLALLLGGATIWWLHRRAT
jgi:hypothetical protein